MEAGGGGWRGAGDDRASEPCVSLPGMRAPWGPRCCNAGGQRSLVTRGKHTPTHTLHKANAAEWLEGVCIFRNTNAIRRKQKLTGRGAQHTTSTRVYIAAYALHYLRLIGSNEPCLKIKQPLRLSPRCSLPPRMFPTSIRSGSLSCTFNPTFPSARPDEMVCN